MKTELKINGIYSLKNADSAYAIILEERKLNLYYLYILDCLNEYTNTEIQERLINDISNNIVKPFSFLELDSTFICNSIDGYLGTVSNKIGDKLLNFFET